ncbi:hypothetical protein M501DRAFT_1061083 [Patellaria atrata CBS 101060]|uniref:Uncharacterized protein n=1 Tax=Patellaria atrata CBS 101060 TaxID=1346257 RepID=A0A9P4S2S4_9PEZI|nr:hypothetical protein M501DRAFT_1061083 [Patellaria atrata CBS 101060]
MLRPEIEGGQYSQLRRPSWSWISTQSPVTYWDDIKTLSLGPLPFDPEEQNSFTTCAFTVRESQRRPVSCKFDVQLADNNPFGEVSSATLTIQSYSRVALLRYTYNSMANETAKRHDPYKYKVEVDGTELQVFADYALGNEGSRQIPDSSFATLLLIHPQITLIIKPTNYIPRTPDEPRRSFRGMLRKFRWVQGRHNGGSKRPMGKGGHW